MKHDSSHPWGESPCFGAMTKEIEIAQIEIRDNGANGRVFARQRELYPSWTFDRSNLYP